MILQLGYVKSLQINRPSCKTWRLNRWMLKIILDPEGIVRLEFFQGIGKSYLKPSFEKCR